MHLNQNNNGQNTCGQASGQPTRLLHADGYVDVSAQVPVFYYHLKDHLGNVRLVITPAGSSNQPEIVQAMEYYPFGMRFESSIPYESDHSHMPNKHTYNSKEEQEMPGRWLDYGFRFYDSQIARFHSVDPLATKNHQQTPYAYAMNNPLRYIDWLGLDTLSVNSKQPVKKDDVVVMDDGSTATANTDEVEVVGARENNKGGLHLTTNKDAGTNNDSRKGDGSSVNIDGILPTVGMKGSSRFLEFIRDAISIFSSISSIDIISDGRTKSKTTNEINEEVNNQTQSQSKVDSSRRAVIYFEETRYHGITNSESRSSGARVTTLRDSAKVAKKITERKNTKIINP